MFRLVRKRLLPWLETALRVWLVLALWPTPLPWVHSHRAAAGDPFRLASHLQEYHAPQAEGACEGWHLHFAYLWDLTKDPAAPPEGDEPPHERPATPLTPAPPPPPLVAAAAPAFAPLAAMAEANLCGSGLCTEGPARRAVVPDGFLNSFRGDIAPHQLIGVLLL